MAISRAVHRADVIPWSAPSHGVEAALDLTRCVCVRPPYLALRDLTLAGERLRAVAVAESPAHTEVGPMPAAEVGRHAAIAGLLNAAAVQADDRRRYDLAREALCTYQASDAPYGAPVTFESNVLDLDKRTCRARVRAKAGGKELATLKVLKPSRSMKRSATSSPRARARRSVSSRVRCRAKRFERPVSTSTAAKRSALSMRVWVAV